MSACDIDIAKVQKQFSNIKFFHKDNVTEKYDVILILDVLEHISPYMKEGLLWKLCSKTKMLIINVPEIRKQEQIIDNNVNILELLIFLDSQSMKLIHFENWSTSTEETYNLMVLKCLM